jgi:hypothetical protein
MGGLLSKSKYAIIPQIYGEVLSTPIMKYVYWMEDIMPEGLERHFEVLLELGVIEEVGNSPAHHRYQIGPKFVAFHRDEETIVLLPQLREFVCIDSGQGQKCQMG